MIIFSLIAIDIDCIGSVSIDIADYVEFSVCVFCMYPSLIGDILSCINDYIAVRGSYGVSIDAQTIDFIAISTHLTFDLRYVCGGECRNSHCTNEHGTHKDREQFLFHQNSFFPFYKQVNIRTHKTLSRPQKRICQRCGWTPPCGRCRFMLPKHTM